MDVDIFFILSEAWASIRAFFETSFLVAAFKFFIFIYIVVLLVDIAILSYFHGFSDDLKKAVFGTDRPLTSRSKIIARWEKILARLESDNASHYKVAVLEADALADEMLSGIGYQGQTMGEKLESIADGQLETKHELIEAHSIRNRIIHEPDFALSHLDAEKCLAQYQKFFEEVEVF